MTCIVGVQTPIGVIIGGDSGGLAGYVLMHRADPKVFTNNDYLIGFTSSFRMGQLLRYADLPKPLERQGEDLDRFMTTEFVDAVRKVLKDGGFAKKDSEQEAGGVFLIGVSGRLFRLESDYQIGWTTDGYDACGSGQEVAFGVLHATRRADPKRRVRRALEAAEHHNGGVHGPFTILEAP